MGTKVIPKVVPGALSSALRVKARRYRSILIRWAKRHGRSFPWRYTSDPYKALVAEIMLQRTRSNQVAPIYAAFTARFPTVESLSQANPDEVAETLRPLGLSFRARTFLDFARVVMDKHGGAIPLRAEDAVKLPGAGPYGASALEVFVAGRRLPLIDANIARVLSRVFGIGRTDWRYATADDRRALYETAALCVGRGDPRRYHYALLDFAAKVCTAVNPACPDCPMQRAGICAYCAEKTAGKGPALT